MKKRICLIFFLLFFINISFVFSGYLTPGLEKLSKEIKSLTYSNKYDSAQALVIEFLNRKNLTELEIFYGHYLFGDVLKSSLKSVEAVEQFLKSKNYLKKIQKKEKYESLVNAKIAEAYFDVSNFTEAEKYAQLSIQLNPDSSLRSGGHAVNYIILGYSEYVVKRYSSALNLYNLAIEEFLTKNELCELPLCYIKLAKVYNALKKYPEAEENINKAIFISDSCGIKNYKLLSLHTIFDIYKDNKNYKKALETLEKINDFVRDMHFDTQQSLMSELEIKYETKLAQNENNNLKQINLKNEEILVRQKSALIITISAVLILSVLLFLIFKISGQHKKAEERLQAVNKELERHIEQVKVSEDNLAKLNVGLEQKVLERTAELSNAVENLSRSEELLDDAGKLAKIGGWEINLNDMTVRWTNEVYRIHELASGKMPTVEEAMNFYAPEARPVIQQAVNNGIAKGQGWDLELPFITAKGKHIWVRAIGKAEMHKGKATRVHGVFQNITKQKEAKDEINKLNEELEQKVIERTAQLQKSFKEISDYKYALDESSIVAITDQQGIINHANDRFCEISKYRREELIGQDHCIINSGYHPKEFIRNLWVTIANGKIWRGEFKNKAKDGTFYWVDTAIVPFLNKEGKSYQYLAVRTDITQRKNAEEQLEVVNKELESFSYSVSHDLRAPLRAINGYVQMLNEDYSAELDNEGKRIIETIRHNTTKMGTLIDELLAFSKLGRKEVRKTVIDMNELAEDVVIEMNKSITHHAEIKSSKLHKAEADHGLLRHVMLNLVSNAIKYSSKKEHPLVEIFSEEKNGEVVFSVKDNGAGFDMRYADKLFGVFQRLHSQEEFEGTGVGLAIVQRIIAKHSGMVWAEGKVNEGATFNFSLRRE